MTKTRLAMLDLEPRDLPAPLVSLVANIDTLPSNSNPSGFVECNGYLYFQANSLGNGVELCGTKEAGSPGLVRDILPGIGSSNPTGLANVGGTLFFVAGTVAEGRELWKSDGTSSGTSLVADLRPGLPTSNVQQITNVSGVAYFSASDDTFGNRLWRSNGTSTGTARVPDIIPSISPSYPSNLTEVSGKLFFSGRALVNGYELFRADSAGAALVRDILPGAGHGVLPGVKTFANLAGTLLFRANSSTHGTELWRSDGTLAGTVRVADIFAGTGGSDPANFAAGDTTLFFTADNALNGRELWKSDGTSSGTELVADIFFGTAGSNLQNLTAVVDAVYFTYFDQNTITSGNELWRSDGSSAGTGIVIDLLPGAGSSNPTYLTNLGGLLYFRAGRVDVGYELWKTGGSSLDTTLVADIMPGFGSSNPSKITALGNSVVFAANNGVSGTELYLAKSTGWSSIDLFTGTGNGPTVMGPKVDINGTMYFAANNGPQGTELWASDGTSTGTRLVRNISTMGSSNPQSLINVGGTLYFTANDGINGREIWKSDGTSSGTVLVQNFDPSASNYSYFGQFTEAAGILYFTTGINRELYRTSGAAGISLVRDINPGIAYSEPSSLVNIRGTLYFSANDGINGFELWKSNGTSTGTVLVSNINGTASSYPQQIIPTSLFQDSFYFTAAKLGTGRELWYRDEFANTVQQVLDILPGGVGSDPQQLTLAGPPLAPTLYFLANDGVNGVELWRSDATPAGTQLVRDITPGAGNSTIGNITPLRGSPVTGQFMFTIGQSQLWKSDGTSTGTVAVSTSINFGGSTQLFSPPEFGDGLPIYFIAESFQGAGTLGREVWTSDGTLAGTRSLDSIPGEYGSNPSGFVLSGNRLVMTADLGTVGSELAVVEIVPGLTAVTSTSSDGVYSTEQTINITLTFDELVTLSGGNLIVNLNSGGSVSIPPPGTNTTTLSGTYTILAAHTTPDLTVTSLALAGGATLKDLSGNNALLGLPAGANLADTRAIQVNPMAPTTVTFAAVNPPVLQRSRLTRIVVEFNNPVNVVDFQVPGAIVLTRTTPNDMATVTTANGLLIAPAAGQSIGLTLTFANISSSVINFGSLADGRWRLSIPSLGYLSPLNGTDLRRLFGDANNDGTVNAGDFADFGNFFGATIANNRFDFNNDGAILADDFAQFGNRFGLTL